MRRVRASVSSEEDEAMGGLWVGIGAGMGAGLCAVHCQSVLRTLHRVNVVCYATMYNRDSRLQDFQRRV